MPSTFQMTIGAGRTKSWALTLYQADGSTAANLGSSDTIRVKIGLGDGEDPLFDFDDTPTANGSSVSIDTRNPATATVTLEQEDTVGKSGKYCVEIIWIDASVDPARDRTIGLGSITFIPVDAGSLVA